ncbi:hypothetical protein LTS08_000903 [Lithohypha guttulata]|uniref:Uncharacterized protein n=1 Tax=Lithohypha guttulata TaxID=1690604 RepID=A0AAN7Y8J0_9EURO|nr:hypothetical protein LTR51_006481 [Lithohypha guttulata]KAK5088690.1 hypothetical protein LTR05_002911 [Lithohypha guttulata]KAK5106780.1 hypothetical protein LTS08_000903 [Lithohypha guttulata]
MRFSITKAFIVALATTEIAAASSWFPGSKAAYNKWHETELERWLSDHDVPYPSPADRKDLESLVKDNWQANVVDPISSTGSKVDDHYGGVKGWIFDSWTESSLKSFLDHHNVPAPQPRNRDSLLAAARQNYDAIAKKAGEYSQYPGDWLYHSWSESDLKEFLDARGLPSPQPTTRDKLIASVRRNARLSSLNMSAAVSSASKSAASATAGVSKSAASAQQSLSDALYDAWSDSQLKEFLDRNGIPVPQGSRKNELIALARKNAAKFSGNEQSSLSASGASAYGAATSSAGNQYAKATDATQQKGEEAFDAALSSWSDSRIKAYLDSRGVPVPQGGKRDELLAQARLNKHKASTGYSAWTFDTWTAENLQKYLDSQGKKAKKGAKANRDELVKQAQDSYASASKKGGNQYASVTNYLAKQTDAAKANVFDTWSDSDLKSYLDSYGVTNYQGKTTNELRAEAKKQYNYFKHGSSTPSGTVFAQLQNVLFAPLQYVYNLVAPAASSASGAAVASASSASGVGGKSASSASSAASASASSASSAASASASSASSVAAASASSLKNEL